jgi:hypothetical protein
MKGRRFAENVEELPQPYFTIPSVSSIWLKYSGFLQAHSDLYTGSKLMTPLAIYHSQKSMAYDFGTAYQAFVNVSQALIQSQVPFDVLFSQEKKRIGLYQVLIVSSQRCLSDQEIELAKDFVNQGGTLFVTGETGLFDENRRQRRDYPWKELTGASLFSEDQQEVYSSRFGKGEVLFFPSAPELQSSSGSKDLVRPVITERSKLLVDSLSKKLRDLTPFQIEAVSNVAYSIFSTLDGKLVTHLLNYKNSETQKKIKITVAGGSGLTLKRVQAFSPDGKEFEQIDELGEHCWVLRKLKTYTCIVWE